MELMYKFLNGWSKNLKQFYIYKKGICHFGKKFKFIHNYSKDKKDCFISFVHLFCIFETLSIISHYLFKCLIYFYQLGHFISKFNKYRYTWFSTSFIFLCLYFNSYVIKKNKKNWRDMKARNILFNINFIYLI